MDFLIIDNDCFNAQLLDFFLRKMGDFCAVVQNTGNVESRLHQNRYYDAVIVDVAMPGGVALISVIKKVAPTLPILIFTSLGPNDEITTTALNGGASGHLSKNLTPGDFYTALMKIISRTHPHKRQNWKSGRVREESKFTRLWRLLKRQIVMPVPDELAACLNCNALSCLDGRFKNCSTRLDRLATLLAARKTGDT